MYYFFLLKSLGWNEVRLYWHVIPPFAEIKPHNYPTHVTSCILFISLWYQEQAILRGQMRHVCNNCSHNVCLLFKLHHKNVGLHHNFDIRILLSGRRVQVIFGVTLHEKGMPRIPDSVLGFSENNIYQNSEQQT